MAVQDKDRCLAYGEPLWFLIVAFYGTIPIPTIQGQIITDFLRQHTRPD